MPFTTTAVVIEGNGRRGREAGNDGFRMGRVRAVCLEGEVGEASGDETRGRLVLIASDMTVSAGFGMNRCDRCDSAVWPVESGNIIDFEWHGTCRENEGDVKERICGANQRVSFKKSVFVPPPRLECLNCWGRVAAVGVIDAHAGPLTPLRSKSLIPPRIIILFSSLPM